LNDISKRRIDLPIPQTAFGRSRCFASTNRIKVAQCISRLEMLAEGAGRLAPRPIGQLLGLLLGTTATQIRSGSEVLYPLWAEELLHRAYNMLRLCQMLECARLGRHDYDLSSTIQFALGRELASQYRSLEDGAEDRIVPCSGILRGVVRNLVELFGSVRDVQLRTDIEPVSLPAYQRRALVLAASELVINALRHAFKGRREGQIIVVLRILNDRRASLTVADDGIGCDMGPVGSEGGIAGGLASLVEADLVYRPCSRAGTVSEITFPTYEFAGTTGEVE
jgi:signal transduction histidine kinase